MTRRTLAHREHTRMAREASRQITLEGPLYVELANRVSLAIADACRQGMVPEQAHATAAVVAADYSRRDYGPASLVRLADLVLSRASAPAPEDAGTVAGAAGSGGPGAADEASQPLPGVSGRGS